MWKYENVTISKFSMLAKNHFLDILVLTPVLLTQMPRPVSRVYLCHTKDYSLGYPAPWPHRSHKIYEDYISIRHHAKKLSEPVTYPDNTN